MLKNLDSPILQGEGSTVPVESHHTPSDEAASTGVPSTSPPHLLSPPRSFISQETKVPQPSSPTHTHVADEAASISVNVIHGGATTTEVDLEDPSKQGRKIKEIDQDPDISLIQHDAYIQGRYEQYMEFDFDASNEVSTVEQVSTAGVAVTTASVDISPASPTRRNLCKTYVKPM
nr:hypothetical protein [Tanacetum cinerariifolium]